MSTTAIERCIAFTQQEAASDIPRVVSKARKELRALTDAIAFAEARGEVRALEAVLDCQDEAAFGITTEQIEAMLTDARKRAGDRERKAR